MLGRPEWTIIVSPGALHAALALGVFVWALRTRDLGGARNLACTTLVLGALFRSFASRSTTKAFWEVGVFTNLPLLGVVVISALVQIGIHYVPAVKALFQIRDLPLRDCALTLLFGLISVTVLELTKLVRRLVFRRTGMAVNPAQRRHRRKDFPNARRCRRFCARSIMAEPVRTYMRRPERRRACRPPRRSARPPRMRRSG